MPSCTTLEVVNALTRAHEVLSGYKTLCRRSTGQGYIFPPILCYASSLLDGDKYVQVITAADIINKLSKIMNYNSSRWGGGGVDLINRPRYTVRESANPNTTA